MCFLKLQAIFYLHYLIVVSYYEYKNQISFRINYFDVIRFNETDLYHIWLYITEINIKNC